MDLPASKHTLIKCCSLVEMYTHLNGEAGVPCRPRQRPLSTLSEFELRSFFRSASVTLVPVTLYSEHMPVGEVSVCNPCMRSSRMGGRITDLLVFMSCRLRLTGCLNVTNQSTPGLAKLSADVIYGEFLWCRVT